MGFVPPPYPYDRLEPLRRLAEDRHGGCVDLSVGTPTDPPPPAAIEALAGSGSERGYPPSVGALALREAAVGWMRRRLGVEVASGDVAACVGTKEFVSGLPHWLHLLRPERDTVLYPAVSYPTYEMGALLAGLRPVPVPVDEAFHMDLDAVRAEDAARALCVWVNSPGNPAGNLEDLGRLAEWGRAHDVVVASDECYVEFTWSGPPRTILEHGADGVLAVHSLSKRSNLAGVRVGVYAGDGDLVNRIAEIRKHAGFMVPGPVQACAAAAWSDDDHVDDQRDRYRRRLSRAAEILGSVGLDVRLPDGSFYLWVPAPRGDSWALAGHLAESAGVLVSPGEFYGEAGAGFVRVAVVQPDDRLDLVAERLAGR